jgi:hypothetical protein
MGVNITRQFPTHGPERSPRGAAQGKGDLWGSLDKALSTFKEVLHVFSGVLA